MGNADQNPVTLIFWGVLSAEEKNKMCLLACSPSDLDTKLCLQF